MCKITRIPYFCVSIVFGEILYHYSTQMTSQKSQYYYEDKTELNDKRASCGYFLAA